jgi:hypothetical protein
MTPKGIVLAMIGAAVFSVLATLAVYAAVGYIVIHFLHKLW